MARLQDVFPRYLRTSRLTLELFDESPEHYECILGVMNSPTAIEIMGDFGVRTHAQVDERRHRSCLRGQRFTNGVADSACAYVLRLGADRVDGELMGTVSLAQRTAEGKNGSTVLPPDLGWGLLEPYMGKGYATEAARALMRFVMDELDYTSLVVFPDEKNEASNRVAEKLGFVDAGAVPDLDQPGRMIRLLVLPGMDDLNIEGGLSLKQKEEK